jgi:hypothetical protein
MDCYVFDTQKAAEDAEKTMFERMCTMACGYGYTLDEDGFIIGKNAATGEDAPDKQKTVKWANVFETLDNRFAYASVRTRCPEGYSTIEENISFEYEDVEALSESSSSSSSSSSSLS